MKLKIEFYKKKLLNKFRGDSLLNTIIRDEIALKFIESIWQRSIVGNKISNTLLYDTMFTIYLPQNIYKRVKTQMKGIVSSATIELEFLLNDKIAVGKFPNFDTPHSPYWQFFFQAVPDGSKVPGLSDEETDRKIGIISEVYPEGRDQSSIKADGQILSIRSKKSLGTGNLLIDKNAFKNVEQISEGEFVVPFGVLKKGMVSGPSNKNVFAKLEIKGSSFLIDGNKSQVYDVVDDEIYIGGRNSQASHDGHIVACIDNYKVLNPHAVLKFTQDSILVSSFGDVSYRNQKVGKNGIKVTRGSAILINDSIQIVIN